MAGLTIYEFDILVARSNVKRAPEGSHSIPAGVFTWLEGQALSSSETDGPSWLRITQRGGRRAVQVTSYVGVIRAPGGFQIEVLPKVGRNTAVSDVEVRQLLIEMLRSLSFFRHIHTDRAQLVATRMRLLEVFISEFLQSVDQVVKRGLRGNYNVHQDNLFALRGKLQFAGHLRQNLFRRDRFFAEFDEFTSNRPENRLLHSALKKVLPWTTTQANQQLGRKLLFVFADVPLSERPGLDFSKVSPDRGMTHYGDALSWAQLILNDHSPLTGSGDSHAVSLLFPMEKVFEAFVAKHLARQLVPPFSLKTQSRSHHLVRHLGKDWFRLEPDLLISHGDTRRLVLDTKWKLLDSQAGSGSSKYGLSQGDLYQLYAYGQSYLDGKGDVVLIYPRTESFSEPLPVFEFPISRGLRLWVLPFCLRKRTVLLPPCGGLSHLLQEPQPVTFG